MTKNNTRTVSRVLDSTLDSVDSAERLALELAKEAGISEDELHRISVAVRESVVNAVVHGNRYNAHKKVGVEVRRTPAQFSVRITDQGEGFDLESLPDPLADENLLLNSGRGIFLIRALMDDLTIRRLHPSGTEVTMIKYLADRGGKPQ